MARGERGEARIGYPLTATFLTSSRGVWVISQNTSNSHTFTHPSLLLSMINYHRHQYFRISVHCEHVYVFVCMCGFCPVFRLPSAALPPFTIHTASLRSSTLRREGGHVVRCARGLAWYPLPTLAQHLGGINFLPLAVPTLSFCRHSRPSFRPQILGSTRSLFIFSFMCPCCLPPTLWLRPFWIL